MSIENVARFTAQQVADAIVRTYGPSVRVEVVSQDDGLYYALSLAYTQDAPALFSCAFTTFEQLGWNASRLINPPA